MTARKPAGSAQTGQDAEPANPAPPAETPPPTRRKRAPVDKDAPHGYDDDGKPKAPHGYLPNGKPRQHPNRDASALGTLTAPQPVSADVALVTKPVNARNAQQTAMDANMAKLHARWVAAGRVTDWASEEMPKDRYDIDPEHEETLKFIIRKAATFHGIRARFGKPVRNEKGQAVVIVAALDKMTRGKKES